MEYPIELAGTVVDCPSCGQPLIMPELAKPTTKPQNFLQRLVADFKSSREALEQKKQQQVRRSAYLDILTKALEDGELSNTEIEMLERKKAEYGLGDIDLGGHAETLFANVVAKVTSHGPIGPGIESSAL